MRLIGQKLYDQYLLIEGTLVEADRDPFQSQPKTDFG